MKEGKKIWGCFPFCQNYLSWISDFKAQDFGFHYQKTSWISVPKSKNVPEILVEKLINGTIKFVQCGNFPVKVVHLQKWCLALTGQSSLTLTCRSISKKIPLCWVVIKISVETQMDRFDSIGKFVSIEQCCSFCLDYSTGMWLFGLAKWTPPWVLIGAKMGLNEVTWNK